MDNQLAIIYITNNNDAVESYLVQAKDVLRVLVDGGKMDEDGILAKKDSSGTIMIPRNEMKEILGHIYKWHQKKTKKTEGEIKVIMALDTINCIKNSYVIIRLRRGCHG